MGAVEGQRSLQLHSLVVHLKATTSWAQTKEKRTKHQGFLTLRPGKVATANTLRQCAVWFSSLGLAPGPQR